MRKISIQRILLCVEACEGITDAALDKRVVEDGIHTLIERQPREITFKGPHPYYEGVRVWEDK